MRHKSIIIIFKEITVLIIFELNFELNFIFIVLIIIKLNKKINSIKYENVEFFIFIKLKNFIFNKIKLKKI